VGTRSRAREAALKILYQLDVTKDPPADGLKIFFRGHRVPLNSQAFVAQLVEGASARLSEIDGLISKYATNWSLERIAMVDRNILRLAIFELLYSSETPPKVAINEAVDLAKRFGSSESGKFVNGILDSIHKARASGETSSGRSHKSEQKAAAPDGGKSGNS